MTSYSTNFDRNKISVTIIILSLLIAGLINYFIYDPLVKPLLDNFEILFPKLDVLFNLLDVGISPIAYISVYSVLKSFYCRYLWKIEKILFIKIETIPNINGIWMGKFKFTSKNDEGIVKEHERKMQMVVVQNFEEIKVTCSFYRENEEHANSVSESQVIGLYYDDSTWDLKFSFKNHSNELGTTDIDYFGYNEFKINPETEEMTGWYFTGRTSGQNYGNMILKRTSS